MSAPSDSETRERPSNRDPPPPPLPVPVLREVLSFSVHAPIGSRVRPPRPRYEQSASNGTWNVKSWFSDEGRWKGAVLPRRSTIGSRGGVYCNGEIINAYKFFSKLRRLKRKKKKCLKYPEIGKGFRKGRRERGKRKKKKKKSPKSRTLSGRRELS